MATKKEKWDGKSRVSNDLYRKRYNEIFVKTPYDELQEELIEGDKMFGKMKAKKKSFKKEQDELNESYKQSIKNKKERDPFDIEVKEDKKITDEELKKIDERNGF
jgi:hypothetical protein|tara:strand:- start:179 stop:493 length:315 start_codon:yes stop_codon:yes gene_type:complete